DVGRLEVAVDNALGVQQPHHLRDQPHQLDRLHRRPRPVRPDQMVEGRTLNERHGEEMYATDLIDVVDLAEVGMIDAGGQTGLAAEAFEDRLPITWLEVRHLERDLAAELAILGEVDGAHAASAQLREDAIAA